MEIDHRIAKVLYTEAQIIAGIKKYATLLNDYYQDKETPIFLGILKGCALFYAHLLTATNFDSHTEFMAVSSYQNLTQAGGGNIQILYDAKTDVKDRNILIIEDIIDSGRTLHKVKELLLQRGAKEVKIITLFEKALERKFNLVPDWVVFELKSSDWIAGWGFDLVENMRHLPYVGLLKKEFYL